MGTSASSTNLGRGFPTPGPQNPSNQQVMDHVFFLSRTAWKKAREENQYDLVIIGTGFCGLATAKRALERNPHCRILMIERGTFFLPEHFQNLPTPFVSTLGGMSETFPWTMSSKTIRGEHKGTIRWQHGMVPFFGGRSTLWSAWCPRPMAQEMPGWPAQTMAAVNRNLKAAESLLHVQPADQVDANLDRAMLKFVGQQRPVYGLLQHRVQSLLQRAPGIIPEVYRTEPAPLASDARSEDSIDFKKFATPAELLKLVLNQRELAAQGKGATLDIVAGCVVNRLVEQDGRVTALDTSRGILALNDAKLVLAMGTLPPTTLVRNAFPESKAGERFSAHFISSIVARIPRKDLDPTGIFGELEMGACYIAGTDGGDFNKQFHIQLSCVSDTDPEKNAGTALRYMPDVVASASKAQLQSSKDHVVFVCAVLGELDFRNSETWFRGNPLDPDPTTNSLLQIVENANDAATWKAMDRTTFLVLEKVLSPHGSDRVEYWHGDPDHGSWQKPQPTIKQRRIDALVHESSTLHIGAEKDAPVDLDYRLKGSQNVYITGGGLWPQGGSWNPTLTMVALAMDLADRLVPTKSTTDEAADQSAPHQKAVTTA